MLKFTVWNEDNLMIRSMTVKSTKDNHVVVSIYNHDKMASEFYGNFADMSEALAKAQRQVFQWNLYDIPKGGILTVTDKEVVAEVA